MPPVAKKVAVFLVISVSLLQISYGRDATKNDIKKIDGEIRQLKKKISQLTKYLQQLGQQHGKLGTLVKTTWGSMLDVNKKSADIIKGRREWYVKHLTARSKWFNGLRYKSMNYFLNNEYKNFSTESWATVIKLRKQNILFLKEKIKEPLVRVITDYWKQKRTFEKNSNNFKEEVSKLSFKSMDDMGKIGDNLYLVSRQVQLQQFNELEKTRSDGFTGIKQIRASHVGGKNYHSNDHNGWSIAGIHDEPSLERGVGIGELVAVINGIDFRTNERHFLLRKPVTHDRGFYKTEPIAFPEIPGEVSQLTSVPDQIKEMKEWFKAFRNNDKSERDFTKYFQPVLTYLEGAWTTDPVDERLSEKVDYTSYTGYESYPGVPYKPSTIMGFDENNKPQYATWNYRFSCHPLQNFLHPTKLKAIFDPVTERRHNWRNTEHTYAAKFDISGLDINGNRREVGNERPMFYTYLDALMEEVPGLDNYGSKIWATGFDAQIRSAHPNRKGEALNGAHYHRPYKLSDSDAMGVDTAQRGYSDRLYVALTTSDRVSGPKMTKSTKGEEKTVHTKASYAIPMEIIYLNPLSRWNPYEIPNEPDCSNVLGDGSKDNPFSATCPELNFHTPEVFFTNGDSSQCSDDDDEDTKYVSSPISSDPICMVGSGIRVLLPKIKGLGYYGLGAQIRQRYPIMPVHGEGSSVWKKLNAIEDSINLSGEYKKELITYQTGESTHQDIPVHRHVLVITKAEQSALLSGKLKSLKKATEPDSVHRHIFTVKANPSTSELEVLSCDSGKDENGGLCFDGHKNVFVIIE